MSLDIVLFVFVILFIITLVSIRMFINTKQEEITEKSSIFIKNFYDQVEIRLADIDRKILSFGIDIINAGVLSLENLNFEQRNIIFKKVNELKGNVSCIDSICFFFDEGENAYYQSKTYGENGIKCKEWFLGTQIYESFKQNKLIINLLEERAIQAIKPETSEMPEDGKKPLSCLAEMPLTYPETKNGIVINISMSDLVESIRYNISFQRGIFLIIDKKGVPIFYKNFDKSQKGIIFDENHIIDLVRQTENSHAKYKTGNITLGSGKYFLSSMRLPERGWTYVMLVPQEELLKSANQVGILLFLLSSFILLIANTFSKKMNSKYYQPVLDILQMLEKSQNTKEKVYILDKNKWEYKRLEAFKRIVTYINSIAIRNVELEKQIENYKQKMLNVLLKDNTDLRCLLKDFEELDYNRIMYSKDFIKSSDVKDSDVKYEECSESDKTELVKKAVEYINANYMKDISLNTLSEYVYLSPSYLGRLFREQIGLTFSEYLIKVRMEKARELLLNTNFKINDIASKCGYRNIQSFNKMFGKCFNCSPSEFRRKYAVSFFTNAMKSVNE